MFLSKSRFDSLYERILKINELYPKVPDNLWEDVFKNLYEAALEEPCMSTYEQNIENLSTDNNYRILDVIDIDKLKSNVDKSLCFVNYLEKLGVTPVTSEYISACYSLCDYEIPIKLNQNLRDLTNSKYNYLEFDGIGYISTEKGRNVCNEKIFFKQ